MNALGKKWMSKDLYELCSICDGVGAIDPARRDPVLSADARPLQPGPNHPDGWLICPGCGGKKFLKIGMTVGQVEVMHAKADKWDAAEREKKRAERAAAGQPDYDSLTLAQVCGVDPIPE